MHKNEYFLNYQYKYFNEYHKGADTYNSEEVINREQILGLNYEEIRVGDSEILVRPKNKATRIELNSQVIDKFKNDSRFTLVGRWIRKMSLDELPQLFNTLIGDMSLFGRKPLTLIEAEKFRSDELIGQLLLSAGIFDLSKLNKYNKQKETAIPKKIVVNTRTRQEYYFLLDN